LGSEFKTQIMSTHKSAFTILKTELLKPKPKQSKTTEGLSSLDVFTSSHNVTFVFSPYPLQKSTIPRAQAELKSCIFTFNPTSSNHFYVWPVVTLTPIDNFNLSFGAPLHSHK